MLWGEIVVKRLWLGERTGVWYLSMNIQLILPQYPVVVKSLGSGIVYCMIPVPEMSRMDNSMEREKDQWVPSTLGSDDYGLGLWKYFLKDFIYLFLEKGEGRDNERERKILVWERNSWVLHAPNWGPGPQPRHVPWLWESNLRPLGSQTSTQSTEPHQPGLEVF